MLNIFESISQNVSGDVILIEGIHYEFDKTVVRNSTAANVNVLPKVVLKI